MAAHLALEHVTAGPAGEAKIARAAACHELPLLPARARARTNAASVLALQRTVGNRATVSALASQNRLLQRDEVAIADADAVHRLLLKPDALVGTREAIHALDELEMGRLISVLRTLRTSHPTDWSILEGPPRPLPISVPMAASYARPLRISVAMEIVAVPAGSALAPEQLADLRARVQRLSAPDQAGAIAALPTVTVPADPTVPARLVTPSGLPTIPGPLLQTLYLSYARRQAGMPGSHYYLDNAFWGGRPTDLEAALRQINSGTLDIIIRVYNRWVATSVPWSFCYAISNTWGGTSDGFNFDCRDRRGLEAALNSSPSFCEDHVGGLYHWWKEGSTPCWREKIHGSPGLHFCTGDGTSVHIDAHQVVSGDGPGGYCSYDIGSVVDHFRDLSWW
jgi:hypothetical protein